MLSASTVKSVLSEKWFCYVVSNKSGHSIMDVAAANIYMHFFFEY